MKQKEDIENESENIRAKEQARRKYLKEYYQDHKEKAQAYQRQYSINRRKKYSLNSSRGLIRREPIQMSYTIRDIAMAPTEKSLKMFMLILSRKRSLSLEIKRHH